ncbi:MAG: phosphate acyltransferase PlsX [Rhodospirillaceae bacterium]|nr:phosphate acyltransferase PlsX [Rhodospirillaceae bacterium]
MSEGLTIALDAMGGDNAPRSVIRGANIARQRYPQARFVFFGDQARIEPLLAQLPQLRAVSTIQHTAEVIKADDKAAQALRSGRQSSMRLAVDAVRDGGAQAAVSAGNTGALMAIAKFVLKTLPGIDRPAIASFFPTMRGESVMLDLGANLLCDSDNLVQFAVMGNVFARTVLGIRHPTVGILNVGSEEQKGHEAIRDAAAVLRGTTLPGRFHGFVEGDDIAKGTVDVFVSDGFTGNVALKAIEGTVKLYSEFLKEAYKSSWSARIGYLLARRALNALRTRMDPRRYNGAIFLGLNGIVVKSHGGTDAVGFANAIGVAADMLLHGAIDKIKEDFAQLTGTLTQAPPQAQAATL